MPHGRKRRRDVFRTSRMAARSRKQRIAYPRVFRALAVAIVHRVIDLSSRRLRFRRPAFLQFDLLQRLREIRIADRFFPFVQPQELRSPVRHIISIVVATDAVEKICVYMPYQKNEGLQSMEALEALALLGGDHGGLQGPRSLIAGSVLDLHRLADRQFRYSGGFKDILSDIDVAPVLLIESDESEHALFALGRKERFHCGLLFEQTHLGSPIQEHWHLPAFL